MKNYCYLLLCLTFMACHSSPKAAGPFDLARLTLTENLPDLMTAQGIEPGPKDSSATTMLGYEIFRSNNAKVLRFADTDFSGPKNQVLFHYNADNKSLAAYELMLTDQAQTDKLISLLGKVAKPVFKQTHTPKGSVELDENGDPVKPENSERQTYRVWENKTNGLTYFLSETGSGQSLATKLTVLNGSTPFGKDWTATGLLDWYKNAQSEAL
jgi:hypothetical protein